MQACIAPRLTLREGREAWLAMRRELDARQLFAPVLGGTLLRAAVLALLLGAALAVAWLAPLPWRAVAWVALALLLAQFAFIGHDAGHVAVSGRRGLDRVIGQACMTVVTGLAFDEWIARHRDHHRHCQVEAHDPDMAVAAVASLTLRSAGAKDGFGRFMTRQQGRSLWLLALLFGHSQRHLSQWAVLRAPARFRVDACALLLHAALWVVLPCAVLDVPASVALLAYVVPLTLLGPYLAAIFWVNHVGMPLVDEPQRFSFLEHQAATSRTVLCAPRWHWLFGGLNFQVEHHLFPTVPARALPAAADVVRRHLEARQLPYEAIGWPRACAAVASHFRAVARAA